MKKVLNITWNVIQVLIIIYVLGIVSFMFFSNKYGYSEVGKYVFDVDDNEFVVIKKTDKIDIGDLVFYYDIVDERYKIVYSNVNSINEDKSYSLDNGENLIPSRVIGKANKKIPVIGFILNLVKEKVTFLLFVLVPILIVFGYHVYKFIMIISYKKNEK